MPLFKEIETDRSESQNRVQEAPSHFTRTDVPPSYNEAMSTSAPPRYDADMRGSYI